MRSQFVWEPVGQAVNGTNGTGFRLAILAQCQPLAGILSAMCWSQPRQSHHLYSFAHQFDGWKASSWTRNPTHQDPAKWIEVVPRDHNSADGVPMRRISSIPTWQAQYTLGNLSGAVASATTEGGHWIHQLVTVGPRQVQLTLPLSQKPRPASDWRSSNCSYTCRAVLNSPKKSQHPPPIPTKRPKVFLRQQPS